jgi:hypothetical protein
MFTRDVFYKLKDKTYFYKAHNPVVYEITSNGEKPAYKVRLGHHPFPPLEYLLSLSDGRKLLQTDYITCYQLFDTESYLLVRYMVGQKRYVGLYDKKGKKTCRYADFHNDDTIFNTASYVGVTEDNRFILSLSAEPLKRRYIQPDDLRALAKNISAEDNPILCLVKFK